MSVSPITVQLKAPEVLFFFNLKKHFSISRQAWSCTEERDQLLQNHRKAEVDRDLWSPRGLTPLPKEGHLELVAQDQTCPCGF